MSVGKDRVLRRHRIVGLGVLTCSSKAGLGVIARCMHPSVGLHYNGNMKMAEVKHNHGWKATHAQSIASACNRGVFNTTKGRWNFITVEPAVKMLRDVQV